MFRFIYRWGKSFAAGAVLCVCVARAFIFPTIVYDHVSNSTRAAEAAAQIARIIEQIEQAKAIYDKAKENLDWHKLMAGGWKDILERLPGEHADKVNQQITELENLGWDVTDLTQFENIGSGQAAIEALENLRKVMDGQAEASDIRTTQEQIWGNVPVTREGVKVESTYQTIATVAAEQGEIQRALKETYENIADLEEEMDGADVVPEDRERSRGRLDLQRARLQTLQIEAANSTNQLLLQVAGMGASNIVRQQERHMRSREELSNWFGSVKQGPRQRQQQFTDQ